MSGTRKRKLAEVDGQPRHVVAEGVVLKDEAAAALKDHQIDGVRFMYRHIAVNGQGCMLAHSMGLGKSAQVVVLTSLVMKYNAVKTLLLVTPKSTLPGWCAEFPLWSKKTGLGVITPVVIGDDTLLARKEKLEKWKKKGGVLMMSYELYNTMVGGTRGRNESSELVLPHSAIIDCLQNPGPDVVVCDEGHTIRNQSSGISTTLNGVQTPKRVLMTGTPMQNCLEELWGMIEFVRPGHFPRREFVSYFQTPIQLGQKASASRPATLKMKQRAFVLQHEMSDFVNRKDQSLLVKELPKKEEYVVVCPRSEFQTNLQRRFRQWFMKRARLIRGGHNTLLYTHVLNKISGHSDLLKKTLEEITQGDRKTAENGWTSELSWAEGIVLNAPSYREMLLSRSPKMMALLYIVEYCIRHKEKLLIFSQWTMSLVLVQRFITRIAPAVDCWCLTGDMAQAKRKVAIESFQKHGGPAVFLISTTAGGMGINLNTAHRAVLFDVAFNPSVDQQAVFRCYRYGLKHPVRIYRIITEKMPEAAVYQSCVSKEWLGRKVVDDAAPSRAHIRGHLLKNTPLFDDPDHPGYDPDEGDYSTLWTGEMRRALAEDPLLRFVDKRMAARDAPLVRIFRHQSLFLDEGFSPGKLELQALATFQNKGGRAALNTLSELDRDLTAVAPAPAAQDGAAGEDAEDDAFLDFIDTSAPLPEDILEFNSDSSEDEADKFVPDLTD
eukprot:TRINITY_DN8929_c0_g1_i3.p1 TRINITY_DN8929_c0_g1~~TRINITY_DN8929_c0_g1_i3.p1  ORF type:complete len:719 (+),score=291.62 TRINITY_DN8929_c0_g1_i3:81-2237(+)